MGQNEHDTCQILQTFCGHCLDIFLGLLVPREKGFRASLITPFVASVSR